MKGMKRMKRVISALLVAAMVLGEPAAALAQAPEQSETAVETEAYVTAEQADVSGADEEADSPAEPDTPAEPDEAIPSCELSAYITEVGKEDEDASWINFYSIGELANYVMTLPATSKYDIEVCLGAAVTNTVENGYYLGDYTFDNRVRNLYFESGCAEYNLILSSNAANPTPRLKVEGNLGFDSNVYVGSDATNSTLIVGSDGKGVLDVPAILQFDTIEFYGSRVDITDGYKDEITTDLSDEKKFGKLVLHNKAELNICDSILADSIEIKDGEIIAEAGKTISVNRLVAGKINLTQDTTSAIAQVMLKLRDTASGDAYFEWNGALTSPGVVLDIVRMNSSGVEKMPRDGSVVVDKLTGFTLNLEYLLVGSITSLTLEPIIRPNADSTYSLVMKEDEFRVSMVDANGSSSLFEYCLDWQTVCEWIHSKNAPDYCYKIEVLPGGAYVEGDNLPQVAEIWLTTPEEKKEGCDKFDEGGCGSTLIFKEDYEFDVPVRLTDINLVACDATVTFGKEVYLVKGGNTGSGVKLLKMKDDSDRILFLFTVGPTFAASSDEAVNETDISDELALGILDSDTETLIKNGNIQNLTNAGVMDFTPIIDANEQVGTYLGLAECLDGNTANMRVAGRNKQKMIISLEEDKIYLRVADGQRTTTQAFELMSRYEMEDGGLDIAFLGYFDSLQDVYNAINASENSDAKDFEIKLRRYGVYTLDYSCSVLPTAHKITIDGSGIPGKSDLTDNVYQKPVLVLDSYLTGSTPLCLQNLEIRIGDFNYASSACLTMQNVSGIDADSFVLENDSSFRLGKVLLVSDSGNNVSVCSSFADAISLMSKATTYDIYLLERAYSLEQELEQLTFPTGKKKPTAINFHIAEDRELYVQSIVSSSRVIIYGGTLAAYKITAPSVILSNATIAAWGELRISGDLISEGEDRIMAPYDATGATIYTTLGGKITASKSVIKTYFAVHRDEGQPSVTDLMSEQLPDGAILANIPNADFSKLLPESGAQISDARVTFSRDTKKRLVCKYVPIADANIALYSAKSGEFGTTLIGYYKTFEEASAAANKLPKADGIVWFKILKSMTVSKITLPTGKEVILWGEEQLDESYPVITLTKNCTIVVPVSVSDLSFGGDDAKLTFTKAVSVYGNMSKFNLNTEIKGDLTLFNDSRLRVSRAFTVQNVCDYRNDHSGIAIDVIQNGSSPVLSIKGLVETQDSSYHLNVNFIYEGGLASADQILSGIALSGSEINTIESWLAASNVLYKTGKGGTGIITPYINGESVEGFLQVAYNDAVYVSGDVYEINGVKPNTYFCRVRVSADSEFEDYSETVTTDFAQALKWLKAYATKDDYAEIRVCYYSDDSNGEIGTSLPGTNTKLEWPTKGKLKSIVYRCYENTTVRIDGKALINVPTRIVNGKMVANGVVVDKSASLAIEHTSILTGKDGFVSSGNLYCKDNSTILSTGKISITNLDMTQAAFLVLAAPNMKSGKNTVPGVTVSGAVVTGDTSAFFIGITDKSRLTVLPDNLAGWKFVNISDGSLVASGKNLKGSKMTPIDDTVLSQFLDNPDVTFDRPYAISRNKKGYLVVIDEELVSGKVKVLRYNNAALMGKMDCFYADNYKKAVEIIDAIGDTASYYSISPVENAEGEIMGTMANSKGELILPTKAAGVSISGRSSDDSNISYAEITYLKGVKTIRNSCNVTLDHVLLPNNVSFAFDKNGSVTIGDYVAAYNEGAAVVGTWNWNDYFATDRKLSVKTITGGNGTLKISRRTLEIQGKAAMPNIEMVSPCSEVSYSGDLLITTKLTNKKASQLSFGGTVAAPAGEAVALRYLLSNGTEATLDVLKNKNLAAAPYLSGGDVERIKLENSIADAAGGVATAYLEKYCGYMRIAGDASDINYAVYAQTEPVILAAPSDDAIVTMCATWDEAVAVLNASSGKYKYGGIKVLDDTEVSALTMPKNLKGLVVAGWRGDINDTNQESRGFTRLTITGKKAGTVALKCNTDFVRIDVEWKNGSEILCANWNIGGYMLCMTGVANIGNVTGNSKGTVEIDTSTENKSVQVGRVTKVKNLNLIGTTADAGPIFIEACSIAGTLMVFDNNLIVYDGALTVKDMKLYNSEAYAKSVTSTGTVYMSGGKVSSVYGDTTKAGKMTLKNIMIMSSKKNVLEIKREKLTKTNLTVSGTISFDSELTKSAYEGLGYAPINVRVCHLEDEEKSFLSIGMMLGRFDKIDAHYVEPDYASMAPGRRRFSGFGTYRKGKNLYWG